MSKKKMSTRSRFQHRFLFPTQTKNICNSRNNSISFHVYEFAVRKHNRNKGLFQE